MKSNRFSDIEMLNYSTVFTGNKCMQLLGSFGFLSSWFFRRKCAFNWYLWSKENESLQLSGPESDCMYSFLAGGWGSIYVENITLRL